MLHQRSAERLNSVSNEQPFHSYEHAQERVRNAETDVGRLGTYRNTCIAAQKNRRIVDNNCCLSSKPGEDYSGRGRGPLDAH